MIIYDTETTGRSVKFDRIVSIAASTTCGKHEFYELVHPQRRIPREVSKIHGITDEDVREVDNWNIVGIRFWEWVHKVSKGAASVTLVGHNAKRFDVPILAAEMRRLNARPPWLPEVRLIDTLVVCRRVFKMLPSHRQAAVYEALFGEEPGGQHCALDDVKALRRIVTHPEVARHMKENEVVIEPRDLWEPSVLPRSCAMCRSCGKIVSKHFTHCCSGAKC